MDRSWPGLKTSGTGQSLLLNPSWCTVVSTCSHCCQHEETAGHIFLHFCCQVVELTLPFYQNSYWSHFSSLLGLLSKEDGVIRWGPLSKLLWLVSLMKNGSAEINGGLTMVGSWRKNFAIANLAGSTCAGITNNNTDRQLEASLNQLLVLEFSEIIWLLHQDALLLQLVLRVLLCWNYECYFGHWNFLWQRVTAFLAGMWFSIHG